MKRVYCNKQIQYWDNVCSALSDLAGTAENLSEEDKVEFQEITGFSIPHLLEAYSNLLNSKGMKGELEDVYDKLSALADAVESMANHNQEKFECCTGLDVQTLLDAKYDMWHYIYEVE